MEEMNEWLAEIRNGNETAFKKLFYEFYDPLYRQAYRYVTDAQVAEEIVQDTFVNLWNKRSSLKIQSSLAAYLGVSIRNHSLNYLKSRYARQRSLILEPSELELADTPRMETLSREELRQLLEQAIAQLPEKCRIIFTLSRNHGLTYQEIADKLGITKETVKTQIKIALQKLRLFLEEHWEICLLFFPIL